MNLTWEEAKQKVAEKHGFENVEQMIGASLLDSTTPKITDLMSEAANLMNESNLARIKQHEEKLNEQLKRIHGQEGRIHGQTSKIAVMEARIKELEDGMKSAKESFECIQSELFGSLNDICFAEIVSIKQLLCTE